MQAPKHKQFTKIPTPSRQRSERDGLGHRSVGGLGVSRGYLFDRFRCNGELWGLATIHFFFFRMGYDTSEDTILSRPREPPVYLGNGGR